MGFSNGITKPFLVPGPLDIPETPFSTDDAGIFHDICEGKSFAEPARELCKLAETLKASQGSFGVDYTRLGQQAAPLLLKLLEACREEWKP